MVYSSEEQDVFERYSIMKREQQFGLVMLSSIVLAMSSAVLADQPLPTITVTGTAEVRVVPDRCVLTFSIDSRARELDVAVADNDVKIKAVVEFLKSKNISPRDIRANILNIRPIYKQNVPVKAQVMQQAIRPNAPANAQDELEDNQIKPIGFMAQRGLTVTIRDLDVFEEVYRGLVERGVNVVNGVSFQTSELRKHRDEARLQAVRAAKEKAQAMAQELGATLAAVQTITEQGNGGFMRHAMSNAMIIAGEEAVGSGEIEISETVHVVFVLGRVEMEDEKAPSNDE